MLVKHCETLSQAKLKPKLSSPESEGFVAPRIARPLAPARNCKQVKSQPWRRNTILSPQQHVNLAATKASSFASNRPLQYNPVTLYLSIKAICKTMASFTPFMEVCGQRPDKSLPGLLGPNGIFYVQSDLRDWLDGWTVVLSNPGGLY